MKNCGCSINLGRKPYTCICMLKYDALYAIPHCNADTQSLIHIHFPELILNIK